MEVAYTTINSKDVTIEIDQRNSQWTRKIFYEIGGLQKKAVCLKNFSLLYLEKYDILSAFELAFVCASCQCA